MHPLAPLLILFAIIGILGFIAYVTYTITNDIANKTSQKMQKKNIVVTKDGMKVGVKEVREESYVDTTQRYVFSFSCSPPLMRDCWVRMERKGREGEEGDEKRLVEATRIIAKKKNSGLIAHM